MSFLRFVPQASKARLTLAAPLIFLFFGKVEGSQFRRYIPSQRPLTIVQANWDAAQKALEVWGTAPPGLDVAILRAHDQQQLASMRSSPRGTWGSTIVDPQPVPCRIVAALAATNESVTAEVHGAPATCDQVLPPLSGSHVGRFESYEGTKTCLRCHPGEAADVFASVHYQWQGDASEAEGLSRSRAGKLGGINDFCIYPDINWIGKLTTNDGRQVDGGCARCHVGLGLKPSPEATQEQLENIDCLICHAPAYKRTVGTVGGELRFVPDEAAMGKPILYAAVDIHLPRSETCLSCHDASGGGNNYKRGDLERAHRNPDRSFDVHLAPRSAGGAGLTCVSCHTVHAHRVAGRGVDLRERDLADKLTCTRCHPQQPHRDSKLNQHTARVACQTCHIPFFAKQAPTDIRRDWELPGELDPATGLYEPHMVKVTNVRPVYRFFNGRSFFYEFGTAAQVQSNGKILMAGPLGSIHDRGAQIIPLKHHLGRQPQDPVTLRLLPIKIGIFFSTGNIMEAVVKGTAAVGWQYNGHQFVETERFLGIFHEVAPKAQALSCTTCHDQNLLDWQLLGYTPLATRNGNPLCQSCHRNRSDTFYHLHREHVDEKRLDCSNCHAFSRAY